MTALAQHIANGQRDARALVSSGKPYSPERLEIAWAALTGMCRHPEERWQRRTGVNLGAPRPCADWPMWARVMEGENA